MWFVLLRVERKEDGDISVSKNFLVLQILFLSFFLFYEQRDKYKRLPRNTSHTWSFCSSLLSKSPKQCETQTEMWKQVEPSSMLGIKQTMIYSDLDSRAALSGVRCLWFSLDLESWFIIKQKGRKNWRKCEFFFLSVQIKTLHQTSSKLLLPQFSHSHEVRCCDVHFIDGKSEAQRNSQTY